MIELTPADEPLLTQIVAGLLASGHYTRINPESKHPEVIYDHLGHGEDFGITCESTVVNHAEIILVDLKMMVRREPREIGLV